MASNEKLMIQSVIILGNHIQALGLARQAYTLGIEVILFTDTEYSITRFSNAVRQTFLFKSESDLMGQIIDLNIDHKRTLLIPTNDSMVE